MPIIFPASIKGVTAGALRELKQKGYTTSSGGLFATNYVKNLSGQTKDYFSGIEPGGIFMSNLDTAKTQIEETTDAIMASTRKMVDAAKDANKTLADSSGKLRDGSEKLAVALDKMLKVANRGDFAETVRLTESLVSSLERLADLESRGLLDKVMKAMSVAPKP